MKSIDMVKKTIENAIKKKKFKVIKKLQLQPFQKQNTKDVQCI